MTDFMMNFMMIFDYLQWSMTLADDLWSLPIMMNSWWIITSHPFSSRRKKPSCASMSCCAFSSPKRGMSSGTASRAGQMGWFNAADGHNYHWCMIQYKWHLGSRVFFWNISPIFLQLSESLFVSATGTQQISWCREHHGWPIRLHLIAQDVIHIRMCEDHRLDSAHRGIHQQNNQKSSASHRKQKKGRKEVLSIVGIWVLFLGSR